MDNIGMAFGITSGIICIVASIILLCGFVMVEPNEARVVMFFGKYEGTFTKNGFYWLNPFNSTKKIPLKARNLDAQPIKVNDKVGNPIMIGLVMVWKVRDTYKVMFNIDNDVNVNASVGRCWQYRRGPDENVRNFVKIQADAAVRRIARRICQCNIEGHDDVTSRSSGDVVQKRLEQCHSRSLEIAGMKSSKHVYRIWHTLRR